MTKIKIDSELRSEFNELIKEIALSDEAREMKNYIQHTDVNTYKHCMNVALVSFYIAKRYKVNVDLKTLVIGGFLHDYFLYDWHLHGDKLHGYHHPHIAAQNAQRDFDVDEKVMKVIKSHMWPLTITFVPNSKEAAIVCLADKIVSTKDSLSRRRSKLKAMEGEIEERKAVKRVTREAKREWKAQKKEQKKEQRKEKKNR